MSPYRRIFKLADSNAITAKRRFSSQQMKSSVGKDEPGIQIEQQQSSPTMEDVLFSESPIMFDTYKMVSYLRSGGFTQAQSESITNAMVRISQNANKHHSTQMVTKNEFVSLRSELSILEKADFALLKTDINAIEKRMETSVAEIYTAVERVENRVIKWVIAVAGAIGLAILRFTAGSSSPSTPRVVSPPPPSAISQDSVPIDLEKKKGFQILVT